MTTTFILASIHTLATDGVERAPDGTPKAFRIWRAGNNPTDVGDTVFSERSAALLMAEQAKRGNLYSFDVDHGSLLPDTPPESRKAVGWHRLEVRNGDLWAVDVRWTDHVRAGLTKDPPEWRYFSPAYRRDERTSEVTSYINTALTANPATHAVTDLAPKPSASAPEKPSAPAPAKTKPQPSAPAPEKAKPKSAPAPQPKPEKKMAQSTKTAASRMTDAEVRRIVADARAADTTKPIAASRVVAPDLANVTRASDRADELDLVMLRRGTGAPYLDGHRLILTTLARPNRPLERAECLTTSNLSGRGAELDAIAGLRKRTGSSVVRGHRLILGGG